MPEVWRDVDSMRRQWGLIIRAHGCDLLLGHRLYRAQWSR